MHRLNNINFIFVIKYSLKSIFSILGEIYQISYFICLLFLKINLGNK